MNVLAWDSETFLINSGRLAPRMVCASFADAEESWVLEAPRAVQTLSNYLTRKNTILVGHNLAFDTVVACAYAPELIRPIFEAYRDNRFACTKIRQMLLDIEEGSFYGKYEEDGSWTPQRYGLADLCHRYNLKQLDKSQDSFRMRYWELDGIKAEDYPEAAYTYAAEDARATREVYFCQENVAKLGNKTTNILGQHENVRAHFALQLASVWGIRTDKMKVDEIERQVTLEANEVRRKLAQSGVFRKDGTKDTKRLKELVVEAFEKQQLTPPTTAKGAIKTDADTLNLSGDELLQTLGEGGGPMKLLNTFIPVIKAGTEVPLQPGYEPIVVTGRTSSKNPTKRKKGEVPIGLNIQQLPRDRRDADGNTILGIRNCFQARPGTVFCSVDYSVAELRALAQIHYNLFGKSALKDALDKGIDPHLVMAANILGQPLEWTIENKKTREVKDARQFSKIANFSLPGGLGANSFVEFARTNYNTIIDMDTAKRLIQLFHVAWPEMKDYFSYINSLTGGGEGTVTQLLGVPIRHGLRKYTQACNLPFQAGIAQITKEAMWRVQWECYLGDDAWKGAASVSPVQSPLFGSRVVAMVHDEIIAEVPEEKVAGHNAAQRLAKLMRDVMSEFLPDIPAVADPALCKCWDKDMEAVFDEDGWLIPWERKAKEAT